MRCSLIRLRELQAYKGPKTSSIRQTRGIASWLFRISGSIKTCEEKWIQAYSIRERLFATPSTSMWQPMPWMQLLIYARNLTESKCRGTSPSATSRGDYAWWPSKLDQLYPQYTIQLTTLFRIISMSRRWPRIKITRSLSRFKSTTETNKIAKHFPNRIKH